MAEIIWSSPALSDLEEIAEYIALDKIFTALNVGRESLLLKRFLRYFDGGSHCCLIPL